MSGRNKALTPFVNRMIELNKIYNEDCHVGLKKIADNSIDAIVTDPPYKILKHKLEADWDEDAIFAEFDRIVKPYGFIVFFGRGEAFRRWNYELNSLGWKFEEEIIWNKRKSNSPVSTLQRFHETVSILSKTGKLRRAKNDYSESRKYSLDKMQNDLSRIAAAVENDEEFLKEMKNFLDNQQLKYKKRKNGKNYLTSSEIIGKADRRMTMVNSFVNGMNEASIINIASNHFQTIHPTQKPVELMKRLINLVTDPRDVICDPFSGSASTAIAAIETERNYICFEKDKEYFDDSVKRVKNHVSQVELL